MARNSTRLLGLLFLGAIAAAGPTNAEQRLVISNWDAYMPPDLLERFKAATGIEAEVSVHATNEEIMGKVTASGGQGFDVLFVSSPFAEALRQLGLVAPIDPAQVPNLKNLYPEAQALPHDPGNRFSVPYTWGTTGLCWRSDLVGADPTSWKDLLEPTDALKGKTTMLATDRWLLAAGFLANGDSVNATDQARIDAARDLLIAAKRTLLAYDDTTFYSKLVSGEASLVQAWDGWCNYGITDNPAIRYAIPEEGSDLWVDTMVITAASESKEAAHKFIDFVLDPANGAWVASNILYKVPSKAAMDAVDPALLATYPNLAMAPADLIKLEQLRDVGAAQKAYSRAVSEIMAAK